MSFIQPYFERKQADFTKLVQYGFKPINESYYYTFFLKDGSFRVELEVKKDSRVYSVVYDTLMEEPYLLIDNERAVGDFIGSLREEFEVKILDIISHCFYEVSFSNSQPNRINQKIEEKYSLKVDFPFTDDKNKTTGVYRHKDTSWFGLILNVPSGKLYPDSPSSYAINLKIPQEKMVETLTIPGVYPAYHMSKKHWISVVLNESVPDETVMELVEISYQATLSKSDIASEWVFPSNPSVYPLEKEIDRDISILWWQNKSNQVGDIIYLYSTKPDGCLLYKCIVTKINVGFEPEYQREMMEIKKLVKYPKDQYPYAVLCQYGLTSIRGPRRIPKELSLKLKQDEEETKK